MYIHVHVYTVHVQNHCDTQHLHSVYMHGNISVFMHSELELPMLQTSSEVFKSVHLHVHTCMYMYMYIRQGYNYGKGWHVHVHACEVR